MNNIKNQFYNNLRLLEQAELNSNPIEFLKLNNLSYDSLHYVLGVANNIISENEYYKYLSLVNMFFNDNDNDNNDEVSEKEIISDQTADDNYEQREQSFIIREGDEITIDNKKIKKITSYKFNILVKDKPSFIGELSRTEMELIYKLYSSSGANVQVKSLAREFPQYNQNQIKKILRAFSITKSCSPLAPHQVEEMNIQDAVDFSIRLKENLILKKVEEDKIKYNEQKVKELTKEIINLKDNKNQLKELFSEISYPENTITFNYVETNNNKLIIALSDIHVGAAVSKDSIYQNNWNEEELHFRLNYVIKSLLKFKYNINEIYVLNIGDSLDGYKGETTRGGHLLPQNMNDKEQVKVFTRQMLQFFDNLYENFNLPMHYYCVGESNHKIISY